LTLRDCARAPLPNPLLACEEREKTRWPRELLNSKAAGPSLAAFTLLEVILAIAIGIGVLMVALVFYQQAAALRAQLIDESERVATVRLLMDRITAELRTASSLAGLPKTLTGGSNFVEFVRTDVALPPTRTSDPFGRASVPATDLNVVRYVFNSAADTNALASVIRYEEPLLQPRSTADARELMETNGTNRPTPLNLGEGIQWMRFRFSDGRAWQDSWISPSLPQGVEISFSMESANASEVEEFPEQAEVFRRIIYLPASRSLAGSISDSNLAAVVSRPAEETR